MIRVTVYGRRTGLPARWQHPPGQPNNVYVFGSTWRTQPTRGNWTLLSVPPSGALNNAEIRKLLAQSVGNDINDKRLGTVIYNPPVNKPTPPPTNNLTTDVKNAVAEGEKDNVDNSGSGMGLIVWVVGVCAAVVSWFITRKKKRR